MKAKYELSAATNLILAVHSDIGAVRVIDVGEAARALAGPPGEWGDIQRDGANPNDLLITNRRGDGLTKVFFAAAPATASRLGLVCFPPGAQITSHDCDEERKPIRAIEGAYEIFADAGNVYFQRS